MSPAEREKILRALLFVPCETKEHLRHWVNTYLGVDLPSCTVCDDDVDNPPSNSNPMDFLWEIYSAARDGRDPTKQWYLYYAARDTFKSLVLSIIEVLCLFHLDRDTAHLASVVSQARNVQRYLKSYLKRPVLRDFLTSKNEMTVEVTRYERDGQILSPLEWKQLPEADRPTWNPRTHFVQIIVATLSGTNSLHVSMLCLDELDLAPERPVEEAMMIASPGKERGELPMILMTSSRKFGYGLVQKHIDNADKFGITLKHWNLIDATAPCPPERHLPLLPKISIYYSEKYLNAISEEEWNELPQANRLEYKQADGYQGCLSRCKLFAQCRGRLATKQHSTSPLLKSVDSVQATFQRVSTEAARSQLLCWRPSTEGMVYAALDPQLHTVSAAQMASIITGDQQPAGMTKAELVALIREHDGFFAAGLDWGFAHPFAGVLAGVMGHWAFVIDAWEIPDLDNSQQIAICNERLRPYDPVVYADTAYPGMIKEFKKRGFKMREWKKYAGSVLDGIEALRAKIRPIAGPPQIYFLKGDQGCELLFKRLAAYHWKTDSAGQLTNIPDDTDDDLCDSCRYLVMNVFSKSDRKVMVASSQETGGSVATSHLGHKLYDPKGLYSQLVSELTGEPQDTSDSDENKPSDKSDSFFYDLD